jgi:hypothetical protein
MLRNAIELLRRRGSAREPEGRTMQRSIFLATAAAAIALGALLSAPQARAEISHPYCATPTWSEGLDCDYQSFQQCVAAVAGFNRTCVANPGFTDGQAQLPPKARKRVR